MGRLLTHQTFTTAKLVKVYFYNFGSLFQLDYNNDNDEGIKANNNGIYFALTSEEGQEERVGLDSVIAS